MSLSVVGDGAHGDILSGMRGWGNRGDSGRSVGVTAVIICPYALTHHQQLAVSAKQIQIILKNRLTVRTTVLYLHVSKMEYILCI